MTFSQFEESIWHWLGLDAGGSETRDHGFEIEPSIEAVFELSEIAWHVLAADGAVGSGERGLDVAQRSVDPFEGRGMDRLWTRPGLDHVVDASGLGDGTEAAQAVADHVTGWVEAAFGEFGHRVAAELGDPAQLDVNRLAFLGGLDGGDERRFAARTTAAFATRALAADVRVIDLDTAGQTRLGVTFEHDLLQLVFDFPGGCLRHAQAAAEFDAGDPLFALGQMIHGSKPQPQGQLGRGEDCARNRRGLPATVAALKQIAGLHQTIPRAAASGAREPVRPSTHDNDGTALFFGPIQAIKLWLTEPLLELNHVASH